MKNRSSLVEVMVTVYVTGVAARVVGVPLISAVAPSKAMPSGREGVMIQLNAKHCRARLHVSSLNGSSDAMVLGVARAFITYAVLGLVYSN